MTIPITTLEAGTQNPYVGAFFLLLFGVVCFFLGFRQYREYRILADAPKAKVRSMPMGLVHLHGKATGEPLTSPLTHTPCFTFVTDIEEYMKTRGRKGGTTWKWIATGGDDDFKEFYLDDGTGRVLVNPGGAESSIQLKCTFSRNIGKDGHFQSVRPTPGFPAPTEQEVWSYVNGPHFRKLLEKEWALEAGSVPGVDPAKAKEVMRKVVNFGQQLESLGTAARTESLGALGPPASALHGGPYRVTETCFLADSDCVIVGTCAENPDSKNSQDRNMIRKGENEKTFLISTQGEKSVGRNLRFQAMGLVALGGALIVGAFALALSAIGIL